MIRTYSLFGSTASLMEKVKKDFRVQDQDLYLDSQLNCHEEVYEKISSGLEIATIRFKKNKIRIPDITDGRMPIFITSPDNSFEPRPGGNALIGMLYIAHLCDFEERIALLDEYTSKKHMIDDISSIYHTTIHHTMGDLDILSAYVIAELERQRHP